MTRLTIEQIFGEGFYQDGQIIRISKTALGLSPEIKKAEVLLAALILRAMQPFQGVITGNGQVVTDELGKPITYDNRLVYDRLTLFFWIRGFRSNAVGQIVERRAYVLEVYAAPNAESREITVGELEENDNG